MSNKIILLVEDNPGDVQLTLRALKAKHIVNEVVIANDGVEACDYIFGQGKYAGRDVNDLPAVVLLDLKMPRMDGSEVLRKIRTTEITKLLPVVILTTSKEEIDLLNGYKLGCNSYVRKPVSWDDFSEAIAHLGLYWLILNESPPKNTKI
jgi:two-component system, response regulator